MHIVKDKTAEVEKRMRKLVQRDVLVGIPADDGDGEVGPQSGANERREGGPTNAQLGYIHDRGAPEAGIPQRQFLVPGIRNARGDIAKFLMAAALARTEGGRDRALHAAGMVAMIGVQKKLHSGPFVPLAPATIAARRRRSAGSSYRRKATSPADVKPLIDTAQLLRSVTYVVRDK